MSPVLIFTALAVWLVGSAGVRFWRRRRLARHVGSGRPPGAALAGSQRRPLHWLLQLTTAAGGFSACLAVWLGAAMFLSPEAARAAVWVAAAGAVSTALDSFSVWRWPAAPREGRTSRTHAFGRLLAPALTAVAGLSLLGFVLFLRSVPGADNAALHLAWPVRGTWTVVSGGRNALTNHHHANPPSQSYAVDMVLHGPAGASAGQAVFAPADGTIVTAADGRDQGDEPAEGNLIVLRTREGSDLWLAHLQKHSVRVRPGDTVRAGDPLAAVGSTGSAEQPHLHLHAETSGRPVPIVFAPRRHHLIRGDTVQAE